MMCPKCGGLIGEPGKVYGWAGKWCAGHPYPQDQLIHGCPIMPMPIQEKGCDHCYCKKVSVDFGKTEDHKQCCNCGNKRKITDMEKNLNV